MAILNFDHLWRLNGAPEVKFEGNYIDCKFQELSIVFLIAFLAIIVPEIYGGFCWHVRISENLTFFDLW